MFILEIRVEGNKPPEFHQKRHLEITNSKNEKTIIGIH